MTLAYLIGALEPNSIKFLIFPLGLASTAFWLWMFVQCGKRLYQGDKKQRGWFIAIALTHAVGAAAYCLFRRCEPQSPTHGHPVLRSKAVSFIVPARGFGEPESDFNPADECSSFHGGKGG